MAGEAGGVLRLFRAYMAAARELGHDVRLFSLWEDIDWKSVDLVHLAPAAPSMLSVARVLHAKGVRFVVSPILDKHFPAMALRAVTWVDRLSGGYYRSHLGAAQEICRLSSGVCVMSADEGAKVRHGLGVVSRPIRIVHPIIVSEPREGIVASGRTTTAPGSYVLFVGDLGNERKNVLRLIEACRMAGYPLVLIGSLGDSRYGRRVVKAFTTSPLAEYRGQAVSRERVMSAMAECRVLALPSITEGIGLAALEGGMVGARVVVTANGGTREYFGDLAWYVNPLSVRDIADGLVAAWKAEESPPLARHIAETLTLEQTGRALDRLYQDALAAGKPLEPAPRTQPQSTESNT
jgi:glycosyltransferase involved in cell wall biosynthesis